MDDFHGAKAAVFIGGRLLTYRRDDRPGLPWPGFWDLPGGGREGAESPDETLLRELHEEFGLAPGPGAITWRCRFSGTVGPVWFMVLDLPGSAEAEIVFGDEGQEWRLMPLSAYFDLPDAVPHFAPRLRLWLTRTGGLGASDP